MNVRERLLKTVSHLKNNRFDVVFAEDAQAARDKILEMVPLRSTVGVANSVTVRQIGVLESFKQRGTVVVDPVSPVYGLSEFQEETFIDLSRGTIAADVFISGTNAVTEDGNLVNIDGTGNRVAGIVWILRKSIIVMGRNKIVKNVDEAMDRIKNIITPTFARRRQLDLPCAKAGRCVDCNVPQRACNITVIIEKKPPLTDMIVVMVDEDLGLGWNMDWPKEHIEKIREKYEKFDWPYSLAYENYKAKSRKGAK
jgi:hypothetical protein